MDLRDRLIAWLGPEWPALRDEDRSAFVRLALVLISADRNVDDAECAWLAEHVYAGEDDAARRARMQALNDVRSCFASPELRREFARRNAGHLRTSPDCQALIERLGALVAADGHIHPTEAELWQVIVAEAVGPRPSHTRGHS